jgi:hypothetical protein
MRYLLQTSAVLFLMLAVNVFPGVVLACSGPGVGALVDANIRVSYQLFGVAAFLFAGTAVLFFFRRKRASLIITLLAAVIVAVHPVWTVSAFSGDCGGSKAMSSLKATGFVGILFLVQLALFVFTFVLRRRA